MNLPLPKRKQSGSRFGPAQAGAWRKGYQAQLEGQPRRACPYDRWATCRNFPTYERGLATAWEDGWETAEAGQPIPAFDSAEELAAFYARYKREYVLSAAEDGFRLYRVNDPSYQVIAFVADDRAPITKAKAIGWLRASSANG